MTSESMAIASAPRRATSAARPVTSAFVPIKRFGGAGKVSGRTDDMRASTRIARPLAQSSQRGDRSSHRSGKLVDRGLTDWLSVRTDDFRGPTGQLIAGTVDLPGVDR